MKTGNKKIVVQFFSLMLTAIFFFSGCSQKNTSGIKHSKNKKIPDTQSTIVTSSKPMNAKLSAVEITRLMGNGLNLGNTMEAYKSEEMTSSEDPTKYETFWGQPVTEAKQMIAYKNMGFDSIRIPVAWTNAMDYKNGDYRINKAFLDRVETIVNYALDAGLYVVLNDHWDGGWWGMFGSATPQTRKDALKLYIDMWTQIANRFKHYSEFLIFEGGNEEIGSRLNDANACRDSGQLSEDECYETSALILQSFVDTVRKTGSNNQNRFLLIPGYNTDISKTLDPRFTMPTDSATGKLLISIHYYNPWAFCGDNSSAEHWGTITEYEEQNRLLGQLKGFVDRGYGVIIGEYMAGVQKSGAVNPDAVNFINNFLDNCDMYNFCPMLWETSNYIDRRAGEFKDASIASIYIAGNHDSEKTLSIEDLRKKASGQIEANLAAAPKSFTNNAFVGRDDVAVAWIMYNSNDFDVTYSVGDTYNPDSKTAGVRATDVQIKGEGEYTVALDFTGLQPDGKGTAFGLSFGALGIANGEILFPGYCIDIKKLVINGNDYKLTAKPYTTSDNKICTRVNILNEWVTEIPQEARTIDGDKKDIKAVIVKKADMTNLETMLVTFYYGPPKN